MHEAEEPEDDADATTTDYLHVLESAYKGEKNWAVANDILEEVRRNDGQSMTPEVATALIDVFATRRRPMECLETLKFSREIGVRPRIQAYSNTISCCYKESKFSQALRVFEIMRNDGYVPQQITYSRALSAALKSAQHELVLEIFDDMLRNRVNPNIVTYNNILNSCARVGDVHSAMGVVRAIRQRDLEMTQSSFHSLAICAGKTGHWQLALDAFNGLKEAGFTPAMTMFNSVISACAKGKRWADIIQVHSEMPEEMQAQLQNGYLGGVIMAYAKSSDEAEQRRALEIFEARMASDGENDLNTFAHNAVMLYYLNSNQPEKVFEMTEQMKAAGMEWDDLTSQNIIIAHIRCGNIKTAEELLSKHVKQVTRSTDCYRELIKYYAEVKNDPLMACRTSMLMMQNNPRLSRLDWHTALEISLKVNNKSLYWNFRKWMKVRRRDGGEVRGGRLLFELLE
ncbi:hypothetical protein PINS_up005073 [Pythium insidiosum]|nr:hypothetical protein PINS_up005073 [Pythium insidiosum]